jgi:F420-non-reducing hydrogenase small subunit
VAVGEPGDEEEELEHNIAEAMKTLADPAGTFYRFSMAHSLLRRTKANGGDVQQAAS